jgi:hypothetical protein
VRARISKANEGYSVVQEWTLKDAAFNFASPVAVGEYLYGVGPSKNLVCIDTVAGKLAWSKEGYFTSAAGKAWASMIVMGKNILTLTDGGQLLLIAADPKDFQEHSRAQVCGFNWCYPAYAKGQLFLRDNRELMCLKLLP